MEHSEFYGSHREIGMRWGRELREKGYQILDHVPYSLEEPQITFGRACRGIYQRHFPAMLEEIQGLAKGQNCPAEELEAVLFSMYALVPQSTVPALRYPIKKGYFWAETVIFGLLWRRIIKM